MSKPPTLQELQLENAALQLANSALRQRQEQLLLRLLAQEQQITRLSEQVAGLQTELTQRPPAAPPPPPALPPFIKPQRQTKTSRQPRPQREPRQAHGRHLLPATTADVEVGYANCPTCDYQLSGQSEAWRHQVIELPPPQPLVVSNYINLAERSIRPLAVARKISGGSRSAEGVAVRMRLQTLFGTWLAKGLNPLQECLRMLGAKSSFQSV